ncbi:MAG: hypothetical protein ACUZ8N_16865 [Candidatus Scalindua sp.]
MSRYLEAVVTSIYNSILWESNNAEEISISVRRLKDIDRYIKDLSSHISYINDAATQNLPWSIIKPFDKLINNFIPKTTIMFRPQWEYNYTVVIEDMRKSYRRVLSELENDVTNGHEELNGVFEHMKDPFHIISFPFLERKNVLLHSLIGHEIGHLISEDFITELARKGEFLLNNADRIKKSVIISNLPQGQLVTAIIEKEQMRMTCEIAVKAWENGLRELLADIIGAMIFGPALLFSIFEIALNDDLDSIPNRRNGFYPPWRMRIRTVLKIIEEPHESFQRHKTFFPLEISDSSLDNVNQKMNDRFNLIKEISINDSDIKNLKNNPPVAIAYEQVLKDTSNATAHFKNILSDHLITPDFMYRYLPDLIERIRHGITPNAYEPSVGDRKVVSLVEIINAAWFYRISWGNDIFANDGTLDKDILKLRNRMNRLTLKAIEFADIEVEFRNFKKRNL